jgi:hypothetical protein
MGELQFLNSAKEQFFSCYEDFRISMELRITGKVLASELIPARNVPVVPEA